VDAQPIGNFPYTQTVVDVNGDGRPDVVTANRDSFDISVLLGNADGSFAAERRFAVTDGPTTLVVVDVNDDNRPDVVVASRIGNSVSVLVNLGAGNFASENRIGVSHYSDILVVADVNGDDRPDLITASRNRYYAADTKNVSILLNDGGEGFTEDQSFSAGQSVRAIAVADVNDDDLPDIITSSGTRDEQIAGEVTIRLNNGTGSFNPNQTLGVGVGPDLLVVTDIDGDGFSDLIVANRGTYQNRAIDDVSVLLNNGVGSFVPEQRFAVGDDPSALLVTDVNGDNLPDLITVNYASHDVSILLNQGASGFGPQQRLSVGKFPRLVTVANVNNDGHLDLLIGNANSHDVSVLLGIGNGQFAPELRATVDGSPKALASVDLNGDQRLDLISANLAGPGGSVSILAGNGDGSFAQSKQFRVGSAAYVLATADFNGDGRPDLAASNSGFDDVSVLLGNGDGNFAAERRIEVGPPGLGILAPRALVSADFNGHGRPDLVTLRILRNQVSVLLGNGDGGFSDAQRYDVGTSPAQLAVVDLNGDRQLDLVTTNRYSNDVSVLLNDGTGGFRPQQRHTTGEDPGPLLVADVNGDGRPDLVAANLAFDLYTYTVIDSLSVLLNRGDGSFATEQRLEVGDDPIALAAADVNGDDLLDLIAANRKSNDVSVLLNNGAGGFAAEQRLPVGLTPTSLILTDVNGDGSPDLITANLHYTNTPYYVAPEGSVSVLLNDGNGSFAGEQGFAVGIGPRTLVVTDVNGDGRPDLVTANRESSDLSVLLNDGNGSFSAEQRLPAGGGPGALLVTDMNGDGRPDLLTSNLGDGDVAVQLNRGDGTFADSRFQPSGTPNNSPLISPVNGDVTPDSIVVDGSGTILLRRGIPNQPGRFTAPTPINPGNPALDVALVRNVNSQTIVAAVNKTANLVSLYTVAADGSATQLHPDEGEAEFVNLSLPVRLASTDWDADGFGDLAVVNAGNSTVRIYRGLGDGHFAFMTELTVGTGQAEIELADFDGDDDIDILVASDTSGDVSIFLNAGSGDFKTVGPFRAGFGQEGVKTTFDNTVFVHSLAETTGLTVSDFDEDGTLDVVAMNSNYHSFTFLAGTEKGTVVNATIASSRTLTGAASTLIRSGQFDAANSPLDVAVLNPDEQTITIFLGQGNGSFIKGFTIKAGTEPSGFSVAHVNDDNGDTFIDEFDQADLLVGNELGDLLILFGQGDGTFAPPRPDGQSIPLAVTDLDGDGKDDFVIASESFDRVSVQFGGEDPGIFQDNANGLFAPDAVRLIDIDDDEVEDLVVANSGANQVYVYLGEMDGDTLQFRTDAVGAQRFDVGTNPVGMTFAKLNDDDFLDIIVTNKGSNSLTFLQSTGSGASWTLTNAVRSNTGLNSGPTSTILRDVRRADGTRGRDGIPDILVSNGQSNTVGVIPGNADGSFDLNPSNQINVGINPTLLIGVTGGFVSINGGGTLTRISNALRVVDTVATRGFGPSSALAGDFNGDGSIDLIVGSNDGILELFLDNGGELLAAGFLDTDLNISAMALSVIQGSRVFYVTSDGVEQAFAFSLDQFVGEERGTVANLPDDSVAIIAALVTGSAELNTEFFDGGDGETVNFGELLLFSAGRGGDSHSAALEQLREFIGQFVQYWSDTFGIGEGSGWQVIVSAVQGVLDTVGAVEVAGFNPFAGWQTVVAHLQLPGISESLVGAFVKAGQTTLPVDQVAAGLPGDAALRDVVFGKSLAAPFDSFESVAAMAVTTVEGQDDEALWPEEAVSRWWTLPAERQTEELLLAGLLAATLCKPEGSGRSVPGRRRTTAPDSPH